MILDNLTLLTWLTLELSDDCLYPPSTCYSEPEKKVRFACQDEIIEEIYEEPFLVDDDIPYGNFQGLAHIDNPK